MPEEIPQQIETGPQVSAILAGFNQVAELRRAIEALERTRDRERLEIVVVDCGSSDESAQLDASFPGINLLRLPHHFGATKAMNIASRTAKAELLFFLSPNVEVGPETIGALVDRLEQTPDAIAACPLLVDDRGQPVSKDVKLPTREVFASWCAGVEPTGGAIDVSQESVVVEYPGREAVMVRKVFVRGMNYFDDRFGQFGADIDLAMQIRRAGKKIRLYPSIRAVRHEDQDPLAGDRLLEADRILGAAALIGKYEGFLAGLRFRLTAILKALVGFKFGLLSALLSGQKIDGSQTS